MSELTFEATSGHDGALRNWYLAGRLGVVQFQVADAAGVVAPSVYLHDKSGQGNAAVLDEDDCSVCGRGQHDVLIGDHARKLHRDWLLIGDDHVIRAAMEEWYAEFFEGRPA